MNRTSKRNHVLAQNSKIYKKTPTVCSWKVSDINFWHKPNVQNSANRKTKFKRTTSLKIDRIILNFWSYQVEISYTWIMELFSEPPFYLDPPLCLLIFTLSVGCPFLLLRPPAPPPLLFGTGKYKVYSASSCFKLREGICRKPFMSSHQTPQPIFSKFYFSWHTEYGHKSMDIWY